MCGKLTEARENQYKANRVIQVLVKYGVINGVKDMLEMIGFDAGYCTYPMKRFTPLEQEAFRSELKALRYEEEYL
ncbi:MAG: hypothetical protein FIA99_14455 [Ruminiclostridium sp.]|nr:hypothetical protein [Ruminiclostridium sp.]